MEVHSVLIMVTVEEFLVSPSEISLAHCTKDQLLEIAHHFSIDVSSEDKRLKASLFETVRDGLFEKEIISVSGGLVISPTPEENSQMEQKVVETAANSERRTLKTDESDGAVELKKLEMLHDLEVRRLELAARKEQSELQFREKDHEIKRQRELAQHDFELKKLELEVKKLQLSQLGPAVLPGFGSQPTSPARPSAVNFSEPHASPVAVQPSVSAGVNFNLGPLMDAQGIAPSRTAPVASTDAHGFPVQSGSADLLSFDLGPLMDMRNSVHPRTNPLVSTDSAGSYFPAMTPLPNANRSNAPVLQAQPLVDPPVEISRLVRMVPPFNEAEVDKYFAHFERVALTLKWPVEIWTLLLQTVLSGKAQSVYSALTVQQGANYQIVKNTILTAYELVPEAYRQKFRNLRKNDGKTFVEFARDKENAFDRWCTSEHVMSLAHLRELMLLEEFKNCVSNDVAMYLNDQRVTTLAQAAVCADRYVLTHKRTFQPSSSRHDSSHSSQSKGRNQKSSLSNGAQGCFYCHQGDHFIAVCPVYKQKYGKFPQPSSPKRGSKPSSPKPGSPKGKVPKSSGLVQRNHGGENVDSIYDPFVLEGKLSFTGCEADSVPVKMLRDTGSAQSFVLTSVLPFSDDSYCGTDVLVQGIEMGHLKVPLHTVNIQSSLISGNVKVAICSQLPMSGIQFLVGNDLCGNKVFSLPEVCSTPSETTEVGPGLSEVFPVSAVTRAQAAQPRSSDLCDSFMSLENPVALCPDTTVNSAHRSLSTPGGAEPVEADSASVENVHSLSLPVDRKLLKSEQLKDPSLARCRAIADGKGKTASKTVTYYWEDGMLMRKWTPLNQELQWKTVYQLVIPARFRPHVLTLAHDHDFAGHLGIKKTYHRVLRYFFWPGLKTDVVRYCRSCHCCQITGKPNQTVPPAPLHPIPVIGEPFERIILDCVGPLPKTKSGHKYLLTIMCSATRYPEAFPLRSLKAKPVIKALLRFFSTFGLPKVVQTDQGSNFLSRLFKQVLKQLSITHITSSAYHPESQGALERFHQTLKSMFRTYCYDSAKEWDDGLPLLLFAVRETTQESLGFSPADLVFGHTVRGPLKLLREQLGCGTTAPKQQNVLEYVSSFRERLHNACACAQKALSSAQDKMKRHFDRKSVSRSFQVGDKVLVLLPVVGSALQAKFSGPYEVLSKLSETDYAIHTPERRRKSRVCHINMLKPYVSRDAEVVESDVPVSAAVCAPVLSSYSPEEDGLSFRDVPVSSPRLKNSELLTDLPTFLSGLPDDSVKDVQKVIECYADLFSDAPSQTGILSHDIDVNDHPPIKQHAYRVNPVKRAAMLSEVEYLVDHGLAEPSSSPWSSPCILVPKPDNTFRFCTDFRKVNAITKPDSFPLPRMEDCVDRVGAAKFVTKLDLLKGYWQVPLTSRAAEISAFVTPDNFMQYRVMPFGLRNAPATFQRLMRNVLSGIPNCEAYLDDLVLHSSDWSSHLELLATVFDRLRKASLTLNLAKCEFGKATVTYLGKQVGQGQVRPVEAKIQAIAEFPTPKTKRAVRRFLGMAGYYRNFCRNFSDVVLPLTNLLRDSVDFVWSADCDSAFQNTKALLSSSPVLSAPDFDVPFKLEVDASATGAGAVLLQEKADGIDHPICYFSKKFLKHQVNYSTIEKEALALLLALQHFEVYLGSTVAPVVVYTDHNPLVFFSRMKNANQRIMRWSLYLQGFLLEIKYKRGCENILADTLSRVYSE